MVPPHVVLCSFSGCGVTCNCDVHASGQMCAGISSAPLHSIHISQSMLFLTGLIRLVQGVPCAPAAMLHSYPCKRAQIS